MTDQQKFRNTFSHLRAAPDTLEEVLKMTTEKNIKHSSRTRKFIAASIAACLVLSLSVTAYAADLGGIQRRLQIWMHGEQTNVTVEFNGAGSYKMRYTDEDGNLHERGGGGVALEADGTERPLTEEELMEEMGRPEVSYDDDGSVWVYYMDQEVEITDKFEDGVCYVQLSGPDSVLYMTVRYQGGYACSPNKYISPKEFH